MTYLSESIFQELIHKSIGIRKLTWLYLVRIDPFKMCRLNPEKYLLLFLICSPMEAKYGKDLRIINEMYQNIHLVEKEKRTNF